MKNDKINAASTDLVALFKGVDSALLKQIPEDKKIDLLNLTLKELFILAESGQPNASHDLANVLKNINSKLKLNQLHEIGSLVDFGKKLSDLTTKLKNEVIKDEIRQEMNHFSRIMGLDKLISANKILPLDQQEALGQCRDFARFLWLVFERRNQKTNAGYKLKTFPGVVATLNSKSISSFSQNKESNFTVILFSKVKLKKLEQSDFNQVTGVFTKFLSTYSVETAISLLDYFLFLTKTKLKLEVIAVQEISSLNDKSLVKVSASEGSFLALKTNLEDFTNTIISKTSFPNLKRQSLGSLGPLTFNRETFSLPTRASQVFLFKPNSPLSELPDSELLDVINKKDKKGKIIPINNFKKFNQKLNDDDLFGVLKPGNKKVSANLLSKSFLINKLNFSVPDNLTNADKIVIEAAHIHADRSPSPTQFETIILKDELVKKLNDSEFCGKIESVLMIDDYHVVNRLDYKKYLSELKLNNFIPDFVILESSPVIRAIAIEILKKLIRTIPNKLGVKGGNLYLTLSQNKAIELVEDLGNKDIVGCVLFDATFSLFKKDIKGSISLFDSINKDSSSAKKDSDILEFYLKEKNPLRRRDYIASLLSPIPDIGNLRKNCQNTPLLTRLEKVKSAEIVNVHEIFYQPQQAKVNALLDLMGLSPITTVYLNPQANDVLIECSALFG